MYTIILFYVIGYFVFLYILYNDFEEFNGFVIFFPLVQSLLVAFIGAFFAFSLPVKYETTTWSQNIITLKDNNSIRGSFFLSSGIINGQMKYVYYQQNEDSTYEMRQVDYRDAKIKYTNSQPKVIITDVHRKAIKQNKWTLSSSKESQTYIFEVPKGSIKNSYELDAQ